MATLQIDDDAVMRKDEDVESESILSQLQTGVFGFFYAMCKEPETPAVLVYIGFLIQFLQLISFPLDYSMPIKFPWNDGTVGWLSTISTYTRIYTFGYGSASSIQAFFFVAWAIYFAVQVVAIVVAVDFSKARGGKVMLPGVSTAMKLVMTFVTGPLAIPIMGALMMNVPCSSKAGYVSCTASGQIIYAVFGIIGTILFFVLAAFYTATVYSRLPTSSAVTSRPTARSTVAMLAIKAVLTIVYAVTNPSVDGSSLQWFLAFVSAAAMIMLAAINTSQFPYYHWEINMIQCCITWLLTWTAVALLLIMVTASPLEPGVSLLFFVLSPLIFLACVLFINAARNTTLHMPADAIDSVTDCELKTRFQLDALTVALRTAAQNNIEMNLSAKEQQAHARMIEEADELLAFGAKRFPNASMLLVRAHYNFAFSANKGLALNLLSRAEQRNCAIDETFTIFFYRKQNEESFTAGDANTEVIHYLEFQQTLNDARRQDEIASKWQNLFWEELLKPSTDVGRLSELAELLNTSMMEAQGSFRDLMRLNANSTQVLRMYASFLIDVANEIPQGNKYIERADELEDQRARSHERGETTDALFDDRNALVSISGELRDVGTIVNINMGAVRLFGYSRADMIGRNVSVIMPMPFSMQHQGFLMNYLETGRSHILNRSRVVFGVHRAGHLVPLDIFVREIASAAGMTFLAVLREPSKAALAASIPLAILDEAANDAATAGDKAAERARSVQRAAIIAANAQGDVFSGVHFAICDANGRVTACSIGCTALFGTAMEEVRALSVELTQWIGGVADAANLARMRTADGLTLVVDVNRGRKSQVRNVTLTVTQAVTRVGSETTYLTSICERRESTMRAHAKTVADDSDEDDEDDEDYVTEAETETESEDEESEAVSEESDESEEDGEGDDVRLAILPKTVATAKKAEHPVVAAHVPATIGATKSAMKKPSAAQLPATIAKKSVQQQQKQQEQGPQAPGAAGGRKATSVSSKSSSSSKMSTSALASKLRSFAQMRTNRDLSENISVLRATIFLVSLFVVVVALVRYFVMSALTSTYSDKVDSLFQAGTRRHLVTRIALNTLVLLQTPITNANGVWPNFWQASVIPAVQQSIAADATRIEAINYNLYITRQSQLGDTHLALYTSGRLSEHNVKGDGVTLPIQYYSLPKSLLDVDQSFITAAKQVMSQTAAFTDIFSPAYYVMRNGLGRGLNADGTLDLLTALNTTCFMYQADAIALLSTMRGWSIFFLLIGIFVMVLVIFVIVRPRVMLVERNKENVLLLFSDIPFNLIQIFQQRSSKRLAALRAVMNGEGAVGSEEDVEDETQATEAAFKQADEEAKKHKKESGEADDDDDDENENENAVNGVKSAAAASGSGSGASSDGKDVMTAQGVTLTERQIRKAAAKSKRIEGNASFISRNITLLKITILVALTIVYYAISYQFEYAAVAQRMNSAPAQINWSQYRRMSIALVLYDLRKLLTQRYWKTVMAGGQALVDVTETDFFADLNMLEQLQTSLSFGSTYFGMDAPTEAKHVALLFNDVCANQQATNAECATVANGLFARGMHASVVQYASLARLAYSHVNDTVLNGVLNANGVQSSPSYAQWSSVFVGGNVVAGVVNYATAGTYATQALNQTFWDPAMSQLYAFDGTFLNGDKHSLDSASVMYQQDLTTFISTYKTARDATLAAFIVLCFLLFVLFFNPMCWQLDAEQKRTSAMLLLIPTDVMERIPTIRAFVQKLDG